jgi:hypothetical protein
VVGKRDAGCIEHLQKKVPDQAMGLFDFVKEKNAALSMRKDGSQAPTPAGFIAHEQLGAVKVKELGHIEAEDTVFSKQVASEFQGQLRLPTPVGPRNRKEPRGFAVGCKPSWPRSSTEQTRGMTWFCPLIRESR